MNKINLFTTYTQEETKFLLDIINKDFSRQKNPLFNGIDINKLSHFFKEKVSKKEIISRFEFIFIEKGKVAVVKDKKIVKVLTKNHLFGIKKFFLDEEYTLIALEESELIFFGIGNQTLMYKNILNYISKEIDDIV